jgi:hypothetical protein
MKWITREKVKVDRVACPWLIKKFVDKEAEFVFVPGEKVMAEAKRLDAIPYDVKDVELGHHGKECSFEAILKKYKLTGDPALVLLGRIVNGADTDNTLYHQPEGPGLEAIAEGFRHLGFKDDHEHNAAEWIVYDALYAYLLRDGEARQAEWRFHQLTLACNRLNSRGGSDRKITRVVDNRPMSSRSQALFRSITEEKPCLAAALPAIQPTFSKQLLIRALDGPGKSRLRGWME